MSHHLHHAVKRECLFLLKRPCLQHMHRQHQKLPTATARCTVTSATACCRYVSVRPGAWCELHHTCKQHCSSLLQRHVHTKVCVSYMTAQPTCTPSDAKPLRLLGSGPYMQKGPAQVHTGVAARCARTTSPMHQPPCSQGQADRCTASQHQTLPGHPTMQTRYHLLFGKNAYSIRNNVAPTPDLNTLAGGPSPCGAHQQRMVPPSSGHKHQHCAVLHAVVPAAIPHRCRCVTVFA
jgi:hypothetical protein